MSLTDEGFVYVATGEGYVREAQESVASLKAAMPMAAVCLITDQDIADPRPFDSVVVRRDVKRSPADKMLAVECPYARAVFIDTDTFIAGDLTPLFRVLDRFDLGLLPETKRGWDYELPGIPHAFAEYNSGVIAFRNDVRMKGFFADWGVRYAALLADPGLVNDQPALREAIWHSDVRVAPLPSEFHFLGNVPNYIMWDARLIHARGDRRKIAEATNRVLGPRAYVPDVGVIPGFHGRRGWLAETLRTCGGMLRLLNRAPTRAAELNPGQWSKGERRKRQDEIP